VNWARTRPHRWKRLIEEGRYASNSEIAAAERINRGCLGRILHLTLLEHDPNARIQILFPRRGAV
jgi:hypothetical protein